MIRVVDDNGEVRVVRADGPMPWDDEEEELEQQRREFERKSTPIQIKTFEL